MNLTRGCGLMAIAIAATIFADPTEANATGAAPTTPVGVELFATPLDQFPCYGCKTRTRWVDENGNVCWLGPLLCDVQQTQHRLLTGDAPCGSWSNGEEGLLASSKPKSKVALVLVDDEGWEEDMGNTPCVRCGDESNCHDDWDEGGCHLACGSGPFEAANAVPAGIAGAVISENPEEVRRLLSEEGAYFYNVERRAIQERSPCDDGLVVASYELTEAGARALERLLESSSP